MKIRLIDQSDEEFGIIKTDDFVCPRVGEKINYSYYTTNSDWIVITFVVTDIYYDYVNGVLREIKIYCTK